MKSLGALLALYQKPVTQLCYCMKLERTDGVVHAFTSSDIDVTVSALTYTKSPGVDVSSLAGTASYAVDNLETTLLPDPDAFLEVDLLAGRLNYAKFTIFECDYTNPGAGINVLRRGTTGEVTINRGAYTLEFRSLKQAFQQSLGALTSKTCRYRLGDAGCKIDLALWTYTYVVTTVTSRYIFTCTAATEPDDFYGEGIAIANDGDNANYSQKIRHFAAGVFKLAIPMPFAMLPGDSVTVIAGCRKRLEEDCRDKFNNVLEFGGEPHVPGADLLMADPVVSV